MGAPQSYPVPAGFVDGAGSVQAVSSATPMPVTGGSGPGGTGQTATMLSNAAGAGTTGTDITWNGGDGTIDVDGTFNGTSVVGQYLSKASGNWVAMPGASSLAQAGAFIFNLPPTYHIRLLLSGGTPTGMNGKVTAN